MLMNYKRIGKGLWSYSLFPENVNIEDLIQKNGDSHDYYQSIFKYKKEHYTKFITGLKSACEYLNIPFSEENAINLTGKVFQQLKRKIDAGDTKAEELKSGFSISGTSDVYTTKLVFDFDHEDNILLAKQDTEAMIKKLKADGLSKDNIQVCFSGNKGFSIEVVTKESFNQEEFANMVFTYAKEFKTLDQKVKDTQRLFRLPLTKHNKSGLYKTPIDPDKLTGLSVNDILKQAKEISCSFSVTSYSILYGYGWTLK
jgi:hypothetical protein